MKGSMFYRVILSLKESEDVQSDQRIRLKGKNAGKEIELLQKRAPIDGFGVGTKLVTSYDVPAIEGVYKLVEVGPKENMRPVMKLSKGKVTLPGRKQVWRYERKDKYVMDVVGLHDEELDGQKMLERIIKNGKLVYDLPSLKEIKEKVIYELEKLPLRYKKLINPSTYPVKKSRRLTNLVLRLKRALINKSKIIPNYNFV